MKKKPSKNINKTANDCSDKKDLIDETFRQLNEIYNNGYDFVIGRSKVHNLIYLLDYTSIYKAVISKIDPTPVKSIDFIKSKLKE